MNGDILTDLDYTALDCKPIRNRKPLQPLPPTSAIPISISGCLRRTQDNRIIAFREKPTYHFDVSMGVYVFSKEILEYVPGQTFRV